MLIKFQNIDDAVKVLCIYHNQEINGKNIKISFAKS